MNITLPREQQEWLEAQVKAGAYDSVEDAITSILAEHMEPDIDDMAWARPLVDEGRASLEQGKGLTLAEHLAHIDETLEKLKRR
jgi:antitoxin ParD1/3/4